MTSSADRSIIPCERMVFGPPSTSGLPYTLSITRTELKISGVELLLQVEPGGDFLFVLFGDFYEENRKKMPLIPMSGNDNSPMVAPLHLPFSAERIAIDLVDTSGEPVPELSCVFDFENHALISLPEAQALPLGTSIEGGLSPIGAPGKGGRKINGWGPPGAGTYPRALTLVSLEIKETGEYDLRLATDCRGTVAFLRLYVQARSRPVDLKLARSRGYETGPGFAWIVLPPGTACIGLEFYSTEGSLIPELSCRLLLRSSTFLPPGTVALTPSDALAAQPVFAEILNTPPTASCGEPGAFLYEQKINIVGIRPTGGGIRLLYVIDDAHEYSAIRFAGDTTQELSVARLQRLPLFGDAGPAFAEIVIPANTTMVYVEALKLDGQADEELTTAFNTTTLDLGFLETAGHTAASIETDKAPFILPPDFKLQKKLTFGPQGVVSSAPAITVVETGRSGKEPLRVQILLDDGGKHSLACFWTEAMEYEQEIVILRATKTCPALVEFIVDKPADRIYFDFVDPFERISPELSCVLFLTDGCMGPQQDDKRSPAAQKFSLRDRLRQSMKFCACCRKLKSEREITHVSNLPEDEAAVLRRDFELDWDYCGLCRDCRPTIANRVNLIGRFIHAVEQGSMLLTILALLFKAYFGSLMVCFSPGQLFINLFQGNPFFFGPGAAVFASSVIWATIFCTLPLIKTFRLFSNALDLLISIDFLKNFLFVVGFPLSIFFVYGEFRDSFALPATMPEGTNLFFWELFLYSSLSGLAASIGISALFGRVVTSSVNYHQKWQDKLKKTTYVIRALNKLVQAQRKDQLMEALQNLLVDQMGIRFYQFLERQGEGDIFKPVLSVGVKLESLKSWAVKEGAPGLIGQTAMFGRLYDRHRYEREMAGSPIKPGPVPSELCIPVLVEGKTVAVLNISRLPKADYDTDDLALCNTLSVLLSAGMSNIAAIMGKDREIIQAKEDAMAAQAKAEFLKKAFSRTVAPAVVEKILEAPEAFNTGGERKLLTVFYSDIRSFTSLSEKVSADAMVELLNEYFEAMASIVFAYEGTIDKWIGDAIMAFFGAPEAQPDHARRAIHMSMEMQRKLAELNNTWISAGRFEKMGVPGYPGLQIGIGLHSGEANVGFLGAKSSRMDYTVIGDTVNTAARLVSKAGAGQIIVSAATIEYGGVGFTARPVEAMQLKGKSELVQAYEIVY